MSQVREFYKEKNVFITGGTGFLGKILTEKLLRSCPDIETIYFLMREKKGKSIHERIEDLTAESIFDVLRSEQPDFPKKIVGLAGNIIDKGLGLSDTDRARLVNEVSVIFHLAANVRFDERLDVALLTNVSSVKEMVELARECKNLQAGIYVSTAYSHCPRKSIDEKLYPPPMTYEQTIEFIEHIRLNRWSVDEMKDITDRMLKKWPNTYSYSKAIAESVIGRFAKDIPVAIFRPSIVTTTHREPVPGWTDSILSVHGVMVGMGAGVIHTMQVDSSAVVDLVPVDMVCNALIASAWRTANIKKRDSEDIPIFNYVSGTENPVTWGEFHVVTTNYNHATPLDTAVYYNSVILSKRRWIFLILNVFLHLVPCLLMDAGCRLIGKEPKYYRLYGKLSKLFEYVTYFCNHEWNFENHRIQELWNLLDDEDKKTFPFSMRNLNWDSLFQAQVTGIRRYLLNEPDEKIDEARRRYFRLYIIHIIVRLVAAAFFVLITWKLFCGRGFVTGTKIVGL